MVGTATRGSCLFDIALTELRDAVSHTAGTFVCNHVFSSLAHLVATAYPRLRGGFVHLPFAPEQAVSSGRPSLDVSRAARGLAAVLTTADIHSVEGATH